RNLQISSSVLEKGAYARLRCVRMNPLERPERERQRASPIFARDQRSRTICCCAQKRFDLCPQRLDVIDFQYFGIHARPRGYRGWREVADRCVISRVIDGDVIARLEKAHLTNLLSANARRGDVGDRAGSEFETGVRGIYSIREDGN